MKSSSAKPGVFISPLYSVLTPVIAVNRVFFNSLTNPGMSRGLVISRLSPPNRANIKQFTVREKM